MLTIQILDSLKTGFKVSRGIYVYIHHSLYRNIYLYIYYIYILDFGEFKKDSEFLDICVSNHWFPLLLLLHLWKEDNLRDIFIRLCLGSTKI